MKSKFQEYTINDTVYHREISIFVGDGVLIENYIKETKNICHEIDGYFSRGNQGVFARLDIEDDDSLYVIFLNKFSMNPFCFSVLTHEALHLTSEVMRNIGMPLTDSSEEGYAYYIDMIVFQFLNNYKEKSFVRHN